ncbi:MAG: hypothetical protein M0Z46_07555 [Actinomycetota bacterium]|nr:hypothetical protein [Actinomycetota bacterium]
MSAGAPPSLRGVARAVASRPGLWPVAVVTAVRLARPGWWRRWPPSPWPDEEYWRFRMQTAYGGDGSGRPAPEDVVEFLEWCRNGRWPRRSRPLR